MNAKAKKDAAKTDSKTDDLGLPKDDAAAAAIKSLTPSDPAPNTEAMKALDVVLSGNMSAAEMISTAGESTPPAGDEPLTAFVTSFLPNILRVKRLHDDARLPRYQTAGAACFDLHVTSGDVIAPGASKVFGTGLAFEVPEGYVMQIYSRSGHGRKYSVRLANSVGLVDSDFRGEVELCITNDSTRKDFTVEYGERLAQAMLVIAPQWEIVEVEELSATARGTDGFGSTGA